MNHQKRGRQEIIIFTRFPVPGKTKTRLIPGLGAQGAAKMHRKMAEQITSTAKKLLAGHDLRLSIYYTGGSQQLMENWLGPELNYHEQAGADLGERMLHAFYDAWERKAKKAILVGSDCPAIDSALILEALSALSHNKLVLGPTDDGGYYLVGATCDLPKETLAHIFSDICWGSPRVFKTTCDRAHTTGVTPTILHTLNDIDHPHDLAYFDHHPNPQ